MVRLAAVLRLIKSRLHWLFRVFLSLRNLDNLRSLFPRFKFSKTIQLLNCNNKTNPPSPSDPGGAIVVLLVVEVAHGVVEAADDLVGGEAAHSPLQPR